MFQYQFDSKEKRREDAINAWNTRKPAEEVVARLEEIKPDFMVYGGRCNGKTLELGYAKGIEKAIKIIKQEMM